MTSFQRVEDGSFLVTAAGRVWSLEGTRWTNLSGPNAVYGLLAACSAGGEIYVLQEDESDVWESPLFQPTRLAVLRDGGLVPIPAPVPLVTAIGCTPQQVVLGYVKADPGIADAWSVEDTWQYLEGNGLARFDGADWVTTDLESGHILALTGSDGDVWVGAQAGITRCRGGDCEPMETPLAYSSSYVTSVDVAADGDVWIATSDGVACFDGRHWEEHYMKNEGWPGVDRVEFFDSFGDVLQPQPPALRAVGITVAADGTPWVVTEGGGLLRYDGERWIVQSPEMGMHRAGHIVASAADGSIWLALEDVGLFRFVPGSGTNPAGGPTEHRIPVEEGGDDG